MWRRARWACCAILSLVAFDAAPAVHCCWSEAQRGQPLDLGGARQVHREEFDKDLTLNGPILWAKQHSDVGVGAFDPPGGYAYRVQDGNLLIRAYEDASGVHSGNVQSTSALQSYQGKPIVPGKSGFVCQACYWESRIRFPMADATWGAFWMLSVDDPKHRGHMEVDAIEYYGRTDPRGHHHAIHQWDSVTQPKPVVYGNYTGMDEIADGGWHVYGVDMRGKAQLDGKRAIIVYFDGKEVSRIAAQDPFFTEKFYYLVTLQISPRVEKRTLPQTMEVDYVRVWK